MGFSQWVCHLKSAETEEQVSGYRHGLLKAQL